MQERTPKILLVEDDFTVRYVTEKQLRALGFAVAATAENGSLAVQKANDARFDIILMDVKMPVMDGLAATEKIRNESNCTNSVIIGMTAFAERELCLKAGMNDYLQKPVMLADLSEMLQKWKSPTLNLTQSVGGKDAERSSSVESGRAQRSRQELMSDSISALRKRLGLQD